MTAERGAVAASPPTGQVRVRTAHVVSSQQKAVLRIVRNLAIFNGGVIALIGIYAWSHAMS